MEKKIDIIIITGFLGAGKTTLLNKLVTSYQGQNIGLLINDFGKIPVDEHLIKNSSTDLDNNTVYEISNGSIFCSCLTSTFVLGLKYFTENRPDTLFIETSGMSDPSSMAQLLNDYSLGDSFNIIHALCVVDSTNVLKLRKHMAFVDRQINSANTILFNKSDLVDSETKEEIKSTVKELNDTARLEFTEFCNFDYKSLTPKEFRLKNGADSCNTKGNAPGKMHLPQIDCPKDTFIALMESFVAKTMRLKGFYSFKEGNFYISNNNGKIEATKTEGFPKGEHGISLIYNGKFNDELEKEWDDFKIAHEIK